jgi:hypothetical protein
MTGAVYHWKIEQRSHEWHELRRGIVTASIIGGLLTPTLKIADNDTSRKIVRTLAAERITGIIEDSVTTNDMWRGILDEPLARDVYAQSRSVDVKECGLITMTRNGFTVAYSPDGIIGNDGLIEIKSRVPHAQIEYTFTRSIPHAHMAQIQMGLLITDREWCDYVSYSGGLPLVVERVAKNSEWQDAIDSALIAANTAIKNLTETFVDMTENMTPTERINHHLNDQIGM